MRGFRPDPTFERKLRRQPAFQDSLKDAAEPARRHANRFAEAAGAPWMPRKGSRSPHTVVLVKDIDGLRMVITEHGGHLVEFGSKNNAPHAPLRRGARAGGLELRETPK